MRILLAGATGAIGRPLVRALRDAGHQVIGLTRDATKAGWLAQARVDIVFGDALDREALLRATAGVKVDAVIHEMTALSKPPARHSGMAQTNALRTTGTRHLLEVAHQAGARRFVTQSMVFGYGYTDHCVSSHGAANHCAANPGATALTEESTFGALNSGRCNPHVEAMRANEEMVRGDDALEGIALRYGLFYGANAAATRQQLEARKIPVPTKGERLLAWIHVDDAVSATVAALERGRPAAAYNVVDDQAVSWKDMFTATAEALGAPAPRRLPPWMIRLAAPYAAAMMLDTSMRVANAKARAELGWKPGYETYRDGMRELRYS